MKHREKQSRKERRKVRMPKLKKPTKRQVYKFLLNCLFVVIGNAFTAAGAALFIVPNDFVMGGVTGIGIFMRNIFEQYTSVGEQWTRWVVNITVYASNIILFIVGSVLLGKKFALSTGAGTFLYPMFMSLFELANNAFVGKYGHNIGMSPEHGNLILVMLFGAGLFGLGIGIVMRVGSSTGGTDIPPLILKKYFNIPISISIWTIDLAIVALQFAAHITVEAFMYGLLITLVSAIVVDKVSPIGMKRMQVKIISNHYLEIRDMILIKISRGVTILYGQTGYLKEDLHMLLTVVSARQLVTLKAEVQKIDPKAFMTISVVSEVSGRGFRLEGVDFLMPQDPED